MAQAKPAKPWYRINLNLRRRLREFRQKRREQHEKLLRERLSLHDRAPEEAAGVFLVLQRGVQTMQTASVPKVNR